MFFNESGLFQTGSRITYLLKLTFGEVKNFISNYDLASTSTFCKHF